MWLRWKNRYDIWKNAIPFECRVRNAFLNHFCFPPAAGVCCVQMADTMQLLQRAEETLKQRTCELSEYEAIKKR